MGYKEKYEQALQRAKELLEGMDKGDYFASNGDIENIFPELKEKENEDERIRKAIIRILKGEIGYTTKEDIDKYVTWLEKQGENKPAENAKLLDADKVIEKSKDYRKRRESYGIKDLVYLDEIEEAYYQGMVDADSYPHWISVEEIQPKKYEWFLGYSPLKSPLSSMKIDVYNFISFGQLEAHNITHWMPLPSVEHLRETTKMIEKGGEE